MRYKYFVLTIIILFCSQACKKIENEHDEARNVTISEIDFSKLTKGEYLGYYAGGMYGWRENECKVFVDSINSDSSNVITIDLIKSKAEYTQEFLNTLYSRVISQQSLQVDVVSGATLDSKACLKAVEDALLKSEN